MNLSDDLLWRGLVKDKTFEDIAWINQPRIFYFGVDATADSLQVGNLASLLVARRLIEAGWKAVLLVGGATTLIGDPGGKKEERELKSREEVVKNAEAIKQQIIQILSGSDFTAVDNYDWFSSIGYLEFLRDVGKHFSMTELMQRDFVTDRMGEGGTGISYAEFSYSLIQGYDFWKLHTDHGVALQIGGSDQWGNMLSGVSLIRKKENKESHAFSIPLVVNKATGEKFGKSEEGAIWLSPDKTTETQFRQFWINVDDADVEDYLKVFTFISKEKLDDVMSEQRSNPEKRVAQNLLSQKVTEIVHGSSGGDNDIQKVLTGQIDISEVNPDLLAELRKEIPSINAKPGDTIAEKLAESGIVSSNSEARRVAAGGGLYINGKAVQRDLFEVDDFRNGKLLMRRGKAFKDSVLVEIQ